MKHENGGGKVVVRLTVKEWAWFIGVTVTMLAGGITFLNKTTANDAAFAKDAMRIETKADTNCNRLDVHDMKLSKFETKLDTMSSLQQEVRSEQKFQSTMLHRIDGKIESLNGR